MSYWVTADTHLGHDKLWVEGLRPEGFERTILNNIRRAAPSVLIHLGDVSFYDHDRWHRKLRDACPGNMWLIRGNHDDKTVGWYLDRGWSVVADRLDLYAHGIPWSFVHPPISILDRTVVHGHSHHIDPGVGHLISMELQDYQPTSLRRLAEG